MNINKLRIAAGCCVAALCMAACSKGVTLNNPEDDIPTEQQAKQFETNASFDDEVNKKAVEKSTSAKDVEPYTGTKNDDSIQPEKVYSYNPDGTLDTAYTCVNPNPAGNAFITGKDGVLYTSIYTPDTNGNLKLASSTDYTFNDDGCVTQAKDYTYSYDENGETQTKTPNARTDYTYTAEHTLATQTDWLYDVNNSAMRKQSATTYTTQDGKIVSAVTESIDAGVTGGVDFTYNSNGDLIETAQKDADGKVLSTDTERYLPNGKLAQIETTDAEGNVLYRAIYQYDSKDYLRRINYYEINQATNEMEQTSSSVFDYGNNADKLGTFHG